MYEKMGGEEIMLYGCCGESNWLGFSFLISLYMNA